MEETGRLVRKEWDTLIEIRAQQAQILTGLVKITDDHERRIRFLERFMGFGLGALAVIKIVLDYFIKS